jgi:dolichyl-phosphate beta-glucosyltransferase
MQVRQVTGGSPAPLISLVFPAFNPGAAIDHTWSRVQAFRHWAATDWEFVFVCDGCTDGTPQRLQALTDGAGDWVRVLTYEKNQGKGHAVRLGLQSARGKWRIFTDVDLAYSFEDVLRVATALQQGADVAIASRVHRESRLLLPPHLLGYLYRRRLQSVVFSSLVRWILPLQAGDTQAGLKGLSARAAELILPRLQCTGFEFDCELLTACARMDVSVTEVPVTVRYENSVSTTAPRDVAGMIRKLWAIRRNWREVPPAQGLLTQDDSVQRVA